MKIKSCNNQTVAKHLNDNLMITLIYLLSHCYHMALSSQFEAIEKTILNNIYFEFNTVISPSSFKGKITGEELRISYVVNNWQEIDSFWTMVRHVCQPFFYTDDDIEINENDVTMIIKQVSKIEHIEIKRDYTKLKGEARYMFIQDKKREGLTLKEIAEKMNFEYRALRTWLSRNKEKYQEEVKLEMLKRICFREFEGNRETIFSYVEKEEEVIIYQNRFPRRKRKIRLNLETFKKLEQLGEKIIFRIEPVHSFEILVVFVVPGEEIIQEIEGKWTVNMNVLIDKKEVEQVEQIDLEERKKEEEEREKNA